MNAQIPSKEGFVSFHGYNVWSRMVGDCQSPGKLPLLFLHGCWVLPGISSSHCRLWLPQAEDGLLRPAGSGNSDDPHQPSLVHYRTLCRGKLVSFDKALGLIAGTYWGIRGEGMLALEYALTKPAGLASLILASTHAPAYRCGRQRPAAWSPIFHLRCSKSFNNMSKRHNRLA